MHAIQYLRLNNRKLVRSSVPTALSFLKAFSIVLTHYMNQKCSSFVKQIHQLEINSLQTNRTL